MLIVDSHEDLAWNMLTFGRDYTRSAALTRQDERNGLAPKFCDDTLLGWPDYQRGHIAVIFATLFAAPLHRQEGKWDTQCYGNAESAHRLYTAQLDAYKRLVDENPAMFQLLRSIRDLESVLSQWADAFQENGAEIAKERPVGLAILMEGAEGIRAPEELEMWWDEGVRIIGPAWAGTRFCGGTDEPGPMTSEGFALLEGMADLGFGLDVSHMDEEAALQALDFYPGAILASHSNAIKFLKGSSSNRHLTDRLIQGVLERDGVVGIVLLNMFLKNSWRRGHRRQEVTLKHVAAQIDYICQIAGDARHVGIGSDFDGGFGLQCTPHEVDTIADIQKLTPILAHMGYTENDIAAIMGENWLNSLRKIL